MGVPATVQALGSVAAALLKRGVALMAVVKTHPVFGMHLAGKLRDSRLPLRIVPTPDGKGAAGLQPDLERRYLALFPAAGPLTLLARQFLRQRQLLAPEPGGLDASLVLLMVISFLQNHPSNTTDKTEKAVTGLGALWLDFLEVYGRHFNYQCVDIVTAEGGRYELRPPAPGGVSLPRLTARSPVGVLGHDAWRTLRARDAFEWAAAVLTHAGDPLDTSAPEFMKRPTLLSRVFRNSPKILKSRAHVQAIGERCLRIVGDWNTELDPAAFAGVGMGPPPVPPFGLLSDAYSDRCEDR
eukprot:TRINITY_DN17300_c0_g1_i1.p1 TRINITY_DN17300_c0_g1~~TRINITY_DN17300_c0_g1_i1.p1  ORF type:complete len:325 (-),score=52.39 TRINITY_DN17300_c0_g1_i1:97-987(-)